MTETNITIGKIRFTKSICLGFVFLGLTFAIAVNLLVYGKDIFKKPEALSTLLFWVFAFVGVWLLVDLSERFDSVLSRLRNRGALAMTDQELDQFKHDIKAKSDIAARIGGITMFLLVVIFYLAAAVSEGKVPPLFALVQYPIEAAAAFIAGLLMGRTIVHAFVGQLLHRRQFQIAIMPGHPDGGAGLTPIGDLFLRQALVLLLPAVYFGLAWTVMIVGKYSSPPIFDQDWNEVNKNWGALYLLMFFITMALQLLGFFAPMWLFHVEMKKQKSEQLVIADELSGRITDVKAQLAHADAEGEIGMLKDRLSEMSSRHEEIESLPTWPVSLKIRRRFAISNLIVSLPVILGLCLQISQVFQLFAPRE